MEKISEIKLELPEVLTLGVPDIEGKVILIKPDKGEPILGGKLF